MSPRKAASICGYATSSRKTTDEASQRRCGLTAAAPDGGRTATDLISDALPFGRLWYGEPDAISNAIGYAKFFSRSHDAVIRVYDEAANVIETHEQAGQFKEP